MFWRNKLSLCWILLSCIFIMVYFCITIYPLLNSIEIYNLKVKVLYSVNCIYSFKFSYIFGIFFQNKIYTIHISMLMIFIKYDSKRTKRYEVKVNSLPPCSPAKQFPLSEATTVTTFFYIFLNIIYARNSVILSYSFLLNKYIILLICFIPFFT